MEYDVVPTFPGRPAILKANGGYIYVSIHDAQHRCVLSDLQYKQRCVHPDRLASGARLFREATARIDKFIKGEIKWYKAIGLTPPDSPAVRKIIASLQESLPLTQHICIQCGSSTQNARFCSNTCQRRFNGHQDQSPHFA